MPGFHSIKKGSQLFVVRQLSRWQADRGKEHETSYKYVTKVGRKYGYFDDDKFHLDTGLSYDKDGLSRANGWGFNVYWDRADWEDEVEAAKQHKRLGERIIGNFGSLVSLPHEAVKEIHEILDTWSID